MEASDESLITDAHRARIGVLSEPFPCVISAVDAQHVRDVLLDADPRYADDTGTAAPYALSILEPRPIGGLPPHIIPRILPGGVLTQSEWTWHRDFKYGEPLIARHQVVDIRERLGGRFGRSVLVIAKTEYRTSAGELVAETAHTVTQFDPSGRGTQE